MERPEPGKVEDLATLSKLDDDVLLEELKIRYSNHDIYTYVGDILIAVNPYRDLGIYGTDVSNRYFLEKKSSNPPHIFSVADSAYQCILGYGGRIPTNQCILISGESGAGKTESTKLIIKQIVDLCRGNTQLEQQILQVNPLLEAFGNAQTQMNDNSSRFGKYIQLMFEDGHVMGAKISEYLLEKSRIVRQNKEEESFHIFYYLFAGLSKEQQSVFHLQSPDKYRYLTNGASCLKREPKLLKNRYEDLVNAMDLVGFTDEEQNNMFTIIASILHLGNVEFGFDDSDAAYVIDENGDIKIASHLLGISNEELVGTLTSIVTFTAGEQVKRNYTQQQAEDARDATTKAIYGRMFGWIVNKINQLLAPRSLNLNKVQNEIGILDIFGFEHFEKNSFEQACINLANEQLQFFFNQHVFKLEQEEYIKEGIDWKEIKFVDNQPLLNLFLNKPIGILSLLDEESHFPKGTDESLVDKLDTHFGGNSYYGKSQHTKSAKFTINHYAGKVTYDAQGWLEKNRDTLPHGIMEILQGSTNELIKLIFRGQVTRTGSLALQARKSTSVRKTRRSKRPGGIDAKKRKLTVGGQFKNSLSILMERMTSSSPIFVRCLKPNHVRAPGVFDEKYIKDQLLYTGMLETIKIRRDGFAVRPSFNEFVEKYKIIVCRPKLAGTKENCIQILKASKIQGWQIGKTKVFLKYFHLEQFSDILKEMGKSAIQLQRVARGFLGRNKYKRKLLAAQKEAERVRELMTHIQGLSGQLINHQQLLKINDKKIRDSFFAKPKDVPPVPAFPDDISIAPTIRSYEMPTGPKSKDMGVQAEDSGSDSEFTDDEFVPMSSNKFGTPGTKQATVCWFKETQTQQIYDPVNVAGNFIAEWFHGVISRSYSEKILKSKPVGCFLIRVSESRFGYTLSFKAKDRTRHYMIDQLPNKKFIVIGEPKVHRSLKDLVEHHKQVKISNWDGLLTDPCGQEEGNCDYQDLMDANTYFVLEQEAAKQDIYSYTTTRSILKKKPKNSKGGKSRRGAARQSRPLPNVPENEPPTVPKTYVSIAPQNSVRPPAIPERNYSMASGGPNFRNASVMSNRPLPKRPDEAYQRLLENQKEQHKYH